MNRAARETNDTNETSEETISYTDGENGVSASIREESGWSAASPPLVVAQGGVANGCGEGGALELEMMVGGKDLLTADTLVHADHRSTMFDEERRYPDAALVCVHELLLVCVALAWLAIQLLLLIGCCVLVKRYRNLAEMSMQKDYHSFDNVGFDTVSTHRRVHWPDQSVDILHTT